MNKLLAADLLLYNCIIGPKTFEKSFVSVTLSLIFERSQTLILSILESCHQGANNK